MDKLYFLVQLGDKPFNVFKTYFVSGGGFDKALGIAVIIALVAIVLYYLVFGFASKRLCTKTVWLITMVVSMVATFGFTGTTTGLSNRGNDPKDGLKPALEYRWDKTGAQEENLPDYRNMKERFSKGFMAVKQTRVLSIQNLIYNGLLFFLLSILMNIILPKSNYAKAIMFKICLKSDKI